MFFLSLQYHQPFEKESDNTAYNYLGKANLKNCVWEPTKRPHTVGVIHTLLPSTTKPSAVAASRSGDASLQQTLEGSN